MLQALILTLVVGSGLTLPAQDQEAPARLLCLHGPLSEIAVLLGHEQLLVGADTTAMWPPRLQELPSVGYVRNLSAEGVMSLRPDLVVMDGLAGPPPVIAQLRRMGLALVEVEAPTTIDGVVPRIRRMGQVLGADARAELVAEAVAADLLASRDVAPEGERCLFVFHPRGGALMAGGRGTPAQAIMDHVGLTNALADQGGWVRLEAESAIVAAPTVIVTTVDAGDADPVAALRDVPGLAATPAMRDGRVIVLDTMAALGYGPRVGPELLALARALAPDRGFPESRTATWLRSVGTGRDPGPSGEAAGQTTAR